MNIVKALVLALFAVYWVIVTAILAAEREVYDQLVGLPGNQRPAEIGIMLVLTALLGGLSAGVVRGWRWTFWLILVAFLAGLFRVLASALQLAGVLPAQSPA